MIGSDQGPSGASAVLICVKVSVKSLSDSFREWKKRLRTYQYLTRPKVITVDKHKTPMKLGVINLSLVDLPEHTLFLTKFVLRESFALPSLSIPVLVCVEIQSVCRVDPCEVDIGTVFCMAVGVDVRSGAERADVSVPGLVLGVPPEFALS